MARQAMRRTQGEGKNAVYLKKQKSYNVRGRFLLRPAIGGFSDAHPGSRDDTSKLLQNSPNCD
jgi:hypothetical protein